MKDRLHAVIALSALLFSGACSKSGNETVDAPPPPPPGPRRVAVDLTQAPLVINDLVYGLERKVLEAEYSELKTGDIYSDPELMAVHFRDLGDLYELYRNTQQSGQARRVHFLMQSILGEPSALPEYEGPVQWEFLKPVQVQHGGFELTVEDQNGEVSALFAAAEVTYRLDASANYFSLLKIKLNKPLEVENIAFDVSGPATDIVFKILGDKGEVSLMPQDGKVSLGTSGFTRTLEILVCYPVPESITLGGFTLQLREYREQAGTERKAIG